MAENEINTSSNSDRVPEPEKTGSEVGQQKGTIVSDLPALRQLGDKGGLSVPGLSELFSALQIRGQQFRDVLQVVGEWVDRQHVRDQQTIDRLRQELQDEKIEHARTQVKLNNALLTSGTNTFLVALGGALLGYGLSESDTVIIVIGLTMIVVGCLPLWHGTKWPRGRKD